MVAFYGGSFTAIPVAVQNSLMDAVRPYLEDGSISGLKLSTRPDYIDESILDNLLSHGVKEIELGVQSMDDYVLSLAERGHTASDVHKAVNLIRRYNFRLGLQMMIGLPGDTIEKDIYTAAELIKLRPDFVRIYPTLVIRGTRLEELYKNGCYVPLKLDEAVDICSILMLMFSLYDIDVIRVGLQPTEDINENGDVIAGPFHPAFRQLVESKIMYNMMVYAYKQLGGSNLHLIVNPKDFSNAIGMKKTNKVRFYNDYGLIIDIKCHESIRKDEMILLSEKGRFKLTKKEYAKSRNLQVYVEYK
ncbi:Radical SAM superfamily protein [Caldanaerobius fijiensis DSM 17918]|uniref:Radical SAM superfamily protein n=1 Tax=Caldanaerobius fijiensis DSM 17918 TaxID=1121256 RepID=A0A1M5E6A1_9THEO|nr:radical SAM protein [Caldanaerobius fijiensis]SHF74773.1 Radical SAM superfamily protein [Caldanaerobius fijiensis DSM 17918]